MERMTWAGRDCRLALPEGPGPHPLLILCGGDFEAMAATRPQAVLFQAEGDFTPWPAPGLREGETFAGGGPELLDFLEHTALPRLREMTEITKCTLMGYSLGGLFALWAGLQVSVFARVASLSGSLWYDGWVEYLERHLPAPGQAVYLSLGRAEEKGGPRQMRAVGEATRATASLLRSALGEEAVTLQWSPSGHFTGIPQRWEQGMNWALGG